jgi:FAD/FMN-containing dehydrogenase
MTIDGATSLRRRRRLRRLAGALVIAIVIGVYPVRVALRYAADPTGPKDCPPSDADTAREQPIRLEVPAPATLPWAQRGGTINDVSCLNRTPVYGVVDVRSAEDVRAALAFARGNGLRVSIAGVKHSMGGHAFARNAVVLDMTKFNRIALDQRNGVATVESGVTWHDLQARIHPGFAVKAMQSTDIFTVGGSISVNAHGMDHRAGSVGRTIRAMRVMLPDGTVQNVSPTENARLFNLVVGGYGLFGIILDVDLELTPNVVYQSSRETVSYREFVPVLTSRILPDQRYGLLYGHLSTAPQSLLQEMLLYVYRKVDAPGADIPPLDEVSQIRLRRLIFNLSKHGRLAMRLKWFAEKRIEPMLESCSVSRNQAMGEGEACLVSRNDPMHDSVPYLRNSLPEETDILHEYFIPRDQFVPFVDGLRSIVTTSGANLLNASVRVVQREENVLTYAPDGDRLAIVLYLNQSTDRQGNERMAALTRQLIDLCLEVGGRFFLPYQVYYTREQLERSYPEIRGFLAARTEFDPQGLLTNTFAEKVTSILGYP